MPFYNGVVDHESGQNAKKKFIDKMRTGIKKRPGIDYVKVLLSTARRKLDLTEKNYCDQSTREMLR